MTDSKRRFIIYCMESKRNILCEVVKVMSSDMVYMSKRHWHASEGRKHREEQSSNDSVNAGRDALLVQSWILIQAIYPWDRDTRVEKRLASFVGGYLRLIHLPFLSNRIVLSSN